MVEWCLLIILLLLIAGAFFLLSRPFRRQAGPMILSLGCALPAVIGAYLYWGGFQSWHTFLIEKRQTQQVQQMLKAQGGPQQIIDQLRARLDDNPKSAKGWYLLGKLYAGQGLWAEALTAHRKASQLAPDSEIYQVHYADALWQQQQQTMDNKLRGLYLDILTNNPKQPDALAMLAMDAFMSHSYQKAINYWQRLLVIAPQPSPEADMIRKAIARARAQMTNAT